METIMHWLDSNYLPVTAGVVERFTVNLDGDIDGFVLTDQTLIHTPPRLSAQLKVAIRPSDLVRVRGVKPRRAELIAAVSVETADGQLVVDAGPDAHGAHKAGKRIRPRRSLMNVPGTVGLTLFAPKGQPQGALLEDGTILRLNHKEAKRLSARLRPRKFWCAVKVL
jgi:hypothetical protein